MEDGVNKQVASRWKPGQSGNPLGRPAGSRSKFSEAFVTDFMADGREHGPDVLQRVRMTDPSTYLRVAAVLVPKEMRLEVEQKTPGGLEPDAYAALRRLLDVIESCGAVGDPQAVFAMIEEDLRARMATEIDGFGSKAVATAPANENKSESGQ